MFIHKLAIVFIVIYFIFVLINYLISDIQLMDATDLIKAENYPVETHEVVTEDGHVLVLHRIPHASTTKPPVLLFHGLFFSSSTFVINGQNKSLGFLLADQGYDVWLLNARSTVSHKHKNLNSNDDTKEFFKFTFHEMGVYDLPATIDYILNFTQRKKLHYVGYSQGGTSFYIMASLKPSYNSKIKLASLIAASCVMKHTYGSFLLFLSRNIYRIETISDFLGIYHAPYINEYRKFVIKYGHNTLVKMFIIQPIHYLVYGEDLNLTEEEYLKLYYYQPNDCSLKQFYHYGQIITKGGQFQQYDYGESENLKVYNNTTPTKYDLTKVTAPVALYYGDKDYFVPPKDVEIVSKLLPNVVNKMEITGYAHSDFIYDTDPVNRLYKHIIKYMKLF